MNINPDKPPFRWFTLSLAWLIYFSFGLNIYAFASLITPIRSQLKLTYTELGAIAGAWQLIYIFAAYPAGIVVDRLGYRKSLLLGISLISLSSLLKGFATDFESLFTYTALFGLGGPLISDSLPKFAASWFTEEERGVAVGIYLSGPSVGTTIGFALTNSLVLPTVGSWERVFLSYSLVGFSVAILWGFLGKEPPREGVGKAPRLGEGVREVFKLRAVWAVVGIGAASLLVSQSLRNWLPAILEIKGYTAVEAGFIASLFTVSRIPGSLFIPKVSYYVGSRSRTLSIILLASSFTLSVLCVSGGLPLVAEILIIGFFVGGLLPLLLLILMDIPDLGSKYMGVAGGIFFSIGEIGGFSGPFLIGFLRDLTGSFMTGLMVLSIYTGCMALLAFTIKSVR